MRMIGTITDITARKQAELQIAGQNLTLEALAVGKDLSEILRITTRTVEQLLPGAVASVLIADDEGRRLFSGVAENLPAAYSSAIDGFTIGEGVGSCGTAAFRREPIIVADISHDPLWEDYRDLAANHRLAACWSHPILSPDGQLLGTFAIYFSAPRDASAAERDMLASVARVAGVAMVRKRTDEQLRQSQKALQASEERLQLALDAGELGTWHVDVSTRVTKTDERFRAIFGTADEWTDYLNLFDVIHPDDLPAVEAAVAAATRPANPVPYAVEYRVIRPDGAVRWVFAKGRATFEEGPAGRRAVSFDGTVMDITPRKLAEEQLRASEERFRAVFEHAGTGIAVTSTDGPFLRCNPAFEEIVGYAESELKAIRFADILHPDDREENLTQGRRLLTREITSFEIENRYIHKAGHSVWVRKFISMQYDPNGKPVCHIVLATDVTARRQAEAELLARERELQTLADNTPDILTRFDRQLQHVFANTAIEKATGRPRSQFLGRTSRELGMPVELCDSLEEAIQAVFETGNHRSLEFDFRTPDGLRHYASRLVPELGPDGTVEFVLGVAHDVTDRKLFEQTLAEQDKRKDEFLATLAHELRNPLAPLRNGLQILRMAGDMNKTVVSARDMMDRQLSHLVNLVNDLLDISRVNQGKISLKRERLAVHEVIESAIEACRPTLDEKGHNLSLDLPNETLILDADRTRLVQVVANLLTNAAKYSEPNGQVIVSVKREGGMAAIVVTDNGVGISPEVLPTLWDMFSQVRDTIDKAQGGLGIGLSLVKKLVEMHGGTVKAQSRGLGQGSTFIVMLPLASPASAGQVRAPANMLTDPSPTNLRVLIVDDNIDGAESLAMLLKIYGHGTKIAHSGLEALAAIQAFTPDVVFLDIGLPGMDGYEVARQFRAEPTMAGALLVALTGWGGEDDLRRSKAAGFDLHLTKPVELTALQAVLSRQSQATSTSQ